MIDSPPEEVSLPVVLHAHPKHRDATASGGLRNSDPPARISPRQQISGRTSATGTAPSRRRSRCDFPKAGPHHCGATGRTGSWSPSGWSRGRFRNSGRGRDRPRERS